MRYCETCKWWESTDGKSGACDKVDHNNALATIEATAADDQGLCATLVTASGFGCISWGSDVPAECPDCGVWSDDCPTCKGVV